MPATMARVIYRQSLEEQKFFFSTWNMQFDAIVCQAYLTQSTLLDELSGCQYLRNTATYKVKYSTILNSLSRA